MQAQHRNLRIRLGFVAVIVATLLHDQAIGQTIISCTFPPDQGYGVVLLYTGQGFGLGWAQTNSYDNVYVSARLDGEGAAPGQTGRAYLTTQTGPGTTVSNEIASTTFTFPAQMADVVLFRGLHLPPGNYYLSIIGDSPDGGCGWVSAWKVSTNVIMAPDVSSFGSFGDTTISDYFPASSFYFNGPTPPEFTVEVPPVLQLTQSNNLVQINWDTNSVGYTLQCADTLTCTNWQTITQTPDSFLFQTNATGTRFYRLSK